MTGANHISIISKHLTALKCVLEEIFALVELQLDGTAQRLPRLLHLAALRLLYPAEAALRRLLVVAAQGLKVHAPNSSVFPQGRVIIPSGTGVLRFQLFDTRKNFNALHGVSQLIKIAPRLHSFAPSPLIPLLNAQVPPVKNTNRLCRRFHAFKAAIENIPLQAKRMALWQMRRMKMKNPSFRSPLRPGRAPGLLKKPRREIDKILRDCHDLAFDYAPHNSS